MAGKYSSLVARSKRKYLIVGLGVLLILILLIIIIVVATKKGDDDDDAMNGKHPHPQKYFMHAAAVADSKTCSDIGRNILRMNDSNAVDAAVAMLFCSGVIHLQSTGIGGGGFMVVYMRKTKKTTTFDYREVAPGAATQDMYKNNSKLSLNGPLAVGVPGEVKGLHHVHTKYGGLRWADVLEPSIKLLEMGFPITPALGKVIERSKATLESPSSDPGLRSLLLDGDGKVLKAGDTIKDPKLAATFKEIRDHPFSFYNGSLAKLIAKDFQNNSGIITEQDLKDYKVVERDPLSSRVTDLKMHMMPPPSGGIVVAMIMNILNNLGLTKSTDLDTEVMNLHKLIEAMKYGYAQRGFLGDDSFIHDNMTKVMNLMLNETVAEMIARNKFDPTKTFQNSSYYGGYFGPDDFGTAHVSVLDEMGNAVSATGSINYWFGAKYRSPTTGILYNNEMDDFSTPGLRNAYNFTPTEANYIVPGKRPLSSMSPVILTNSSGDVVAVTGAAGGSRIISAVATVLARVFMMHEDLRKAVYTDRIHNQLSPNVVQYEIGKEVSPEIRAGLEKLGHKLQGTPFISVLQTILRKGDRIYAESDPRKGGEAAGY